MSVEPPLTGPAERRLPPGDLVSRRWVEQLRRPMTSRLHEIVRRVLDRREK